MLSFGIVRMKFHTKLALVCMYFFTINNTISTSFNFCYGRYIVINAINRKSTVDLFEHHTTNYATRYDHAHDVTHRR